MVSAVHVAKIVFSSLQICKPADNESPALRDKLKQSSGILSEYDLDVAEFHGAVSSYMATQAVLFEENRPMNMLVRTLKQLSQLECLDIRVASMWIGAKDVSETSLQLLAQRSLVRREAVGDPF